MTWKRWPQFEGWDAKAIAIKTLAQACGAYAYCSQKNDYLNVELHKKDASNAEFAALHEVIDMIEALTDQDG